MKIAIVIILLVLLVIYLAVQNYRLYKKLKYVDEANMWHKLAITDSLTGIYNRNAYDLQIEKIKRNINEGIKGIVLFDVDDFKMINDTQGHLEGDEVLKDVAKTLLDIFPEPKYMVFRIGGDEFSVLSFNVSEHEIIRRLLSLKKRLLSNGEIRLSKGYAIIDDNAEEAFAHADEMLYADKLSKARHKI